MNMKALRTYFLRPSTADKEIKLSTNTLGTGKSGAKSRAYREHVPLFEKTFSDSGKRPTGLFHIPNIAITLSLLQKEFLEKIGASHDNPREAFDAIDRSDFPPIILDAFKESLEPFEGVPVAVRSDECTAGGNGLWRGGFLLAGEKDSLKRMIAIAKKILKSDFSGNVLAFKKRVGLPMDETPGIWITPLVANSESLTHKILTTFYHINTITCFRGEDSLINIGIGIGGASNKYSRTELLSNLGGKDFRLGSLAGSQAVAKAFHDGEIKTLIEHLEYKYNDVWKAINDESELLSGFAQNLRDSLSRFIEHSKGKPHYLELALEGFDFWTVLQCADLELKEVKKPEIPEEQKILKIIPPKAHSQIFRDMNRGSVGDFGKNISGRGIKDTDHIVYADSSGSLEQVLWDLSGSGLTNYVLITKTNFVDIKDKFGFEDCSGAEVIIAHDHDPAFSVLSHLGGAYREADIFILAGKVNREFIKGLKPGVNNVKLKTYANDALEEAFVATV